MSTEQNKAIARRYFEDIWNRNDLGAISEIISPDVMGHAAGTTFQGSETLKQRVNMLRSIYSEPHFSVEDQIAEGDRVTLRWRLRGTHTGEYMGARPTGKQVTATGINIFRIADGKIQEIWVESDDLGELQQLGVIPAPGSGK
jgi:steroid delta-isomerase-like uncharacterized protein